MSSRIKKWSSEDWRNSYNRKSARERSKSSSGSKSRLGYKSRKRESKNKNSKKCKRRRQGVIQINWLRSNTLEWSLVKVDLMARGEAQVGEQDQLQDVFFIRNGRKNLKLKRKLSLWRKGRRSLKS